MMPKVVVYIPSRDAKELEAEGKDPAEWVREMVKELLKRRREKAIA